MAPDPKNSPVLPRSRTVRVRRARGRPHAGHGNVTAHSEPLGRQVQ